MTEVIEVENTLREGKIHLPEIKLFECDKFDHPSYFTLGLTNAGKIMMLARRDASEEFEKGTNEWNWMYNARLMYYAVFYAICVDDMPAYQSQTKASVDSIIEYVLGKSIPDYTALAEDILASSGIGLITEEPEAEEEPEEEISEESLATGISDYE